jgi:DNA-directed RNA polymerase II subunit RPB2
MFPSRTKAVAEAQKGSFESLQNALLFAYERTHSYSTDTIAMFDHFMDYMMPFIVREFSKIEVICNETKTKHCVQFGNVTVHKPLVQEMDSSSIATAKNLRIFTNEPLLPAEARARGLT